MERCNLCGAWSGRRSTVCGVCGTVLPTREASRPRDPPSPDPQPPPVAADRGRPGGALVALGVVLAGMLVWVGVSRLGRAPDVSLARRDLGVGDLSADPDGFTVTLRWVPPSGDVRGYRVYREDELVADLSDVGASTFVDHGVLPGIDYVYGVETVWAGGVVSHQAGIDVTTDGASRERAIMSGLYDVDLDVTGQRGLPFELPDEHDLWSLGTSCEVSLPCEAAWTGLAFHGNRVYLQPVRGALEGEGAGWMTGCRGGSVPSTLGLRLRVSEAEARRDTWLATVLRGTLTYAAPAGSGCPAARVSYEVTAVSLTPEIDPPSGVAAAEAADDSVYRVEGYGPSCGASGSAFVVAPRLLLTNAHVVAGMNSVWVVRDGVSSFPARVVHFDPERDLAVLAVRGALGPSLPLAARPEHGDAGAILGYPSGGFLTWTQASVDRMIAFGLDIYDRSSRSHRVLLIIANAYPGDSGGPIVSADGEVLGMVARASLSKVYAVPAEALNEALGAASAGARRVPTGPCFEH